MKSRIIKYTILISPATRAEINNPAAS